MGRRCNGMHHPLRTNLKYRKTTPKHSWVKARSTNKAEDKQYEQHQVTDGTRENGKAIYMETENEREREKNNNTPAERRKETAIQLTLVLPSVCCSGLRKAAFIEITLSTSTSMQVHACGIASNTKCGCTLDGRKILKFVKGRKSVILELWAAPETLSKGGGGASPPTFWKGLRGAQTAKMTDFRPSKT